MWGLNHYLEYYNAVRPTAVGKAHYLTCGKKDEYGSQSIIITILVQLYTASEARLRLYVTTTAF